jgi:hypothetical protein
MEGHGFLQAVHANPGVDALIIRGISDHIDDKSQADAENFQELAARRASAFAFEILAKLGEDDTLISLLADKSPAANKVAEGREVSKRGKLHS